MIRTMLSAEVIDGELNILLQEHDDDDPHLSRLGVLRIVEHYLITMIENYRNGDLLDDIVWDEEE